ncbi:MAG: hypothetical protein IT190_09490, partial [Microbacteriaceae bacterium]|nr:hypothetical protein [Microbacteriaceae bacterium]
RLRVPDRSPVPISDDAATAIGVLVRLWCGRTIRDDPVISTAADTLLANPPAPDTTDLQHVYFGSLAMLNVGGDRFRAWLPALTAFVETPCRDEGPLRGSWDPPGGGGGDDDGDDGVAGDAERIRATSIHVLLGCSFYGPVGHALMRR